MIDGESEGGDCDEVIGAYAQNEVNQKDSKQNEGDVMKGQGRRANSKCLFKKMQIYGIALFCATVYNLCRPMPRENMHCDSI